MKKAFVFLLALALILSIAPSFAFADSPDLSSMKDSELISLYQALREELLRRGLPIPDEISLREGKYIIGEDILPGTYKISCTETFGEEYNDAMSSLGSAYSSLGLGDDFGSVFGSFGGMVEAISTVTVEIIGDYGTVIKSFELKAGETSKITLNEKTALQITNGSVKLEPVI